MATNVNLNQIADEVSHILTKSRVNLGRTTKGRTQLIESIKAAIKGASPPDRRNCLKRVVAGSNTLVGPGGVVQMTAAESARADQALGNGV